MNSAATSRREHRGHITVRVVSQPATERDLMIGYVHGLGATPAIWHQLLAALAPTTGATLFGMPWDASGGSDWALCPEPREWLATALEAADRAPDVLVAHSFGANVLLDHLCAGYEPGFRAAVLVSPFYRRAPEDVDWAVLSHYLNDFPDVLRDGIIGAGGMPRADLLDGMVARVRDRIGPYGWLRFFSLFAGTPLLDLERLRLPFLVVGGANDTASYPADCRALAATLPRAELAMLPGCGHFPMADAPAMVADLLAGFLARLAGPPVPVTTGQSAEGAVS